MALKITGGQIAGQMFVSDERLYLSPSGQHIVPEEEAGSLLVGAGGSIPLTEARRFRLVQEVEKAEHAPEPEEKRQRRKAMKPGEDKAIHGPEETK